MTVYISILSLNYSSASLAAAQGFTVSGPTVFVFFQPDKDLDSSPPRALPEKTYRQRPECSVFFLCQSVSPFAFFHPVSLSFSESLSVFPEGGKRMVL